MPTTNLIVVPTPDDPRADIKPGSVEVKCAYCGATCMLSPAGQAFAKENPMSFACLDCAVLEGASADDLEVKVIKATKDDPREDN